MQRKIDLYKDQELGFQRFLLNECKSLNLKNKKTNKPKREAPPDKAFVRDLSLLLPALPAGRLGVICKARQMMCTTIAARYLVWNLLFKTNFNMVWASLKEEQAESVLNDHIYKQLLELDFPIPELYKSGNRIVVESLGNSIRAVPRGATQITGYAYSLLVLDEFSKFEPLSLQDKVFKEVLPAVQLGQIWIIGTANPECLFESLYFQE